MGPDQPRGAGDLLGVELVDAAGHRVLADQGIDDDRAVEAIHQVDQIEAGRVLASR